MELIHASGLAIAAGRRVLVRDISFTLHPGQVLALLGPNGTGKSTLFRTLLGLTPAAAGTIRLQGASLPLPRRAIAARLALVPQAMQAAFPWTVRDFVLMGRTMHLSGFAAPGKADHAAATAALEEIGLLSHAERLVTRLSGGERQLVLIARALAQNAPALLMDEPSSALDFANRERLADLMERLARRRLGLMFSTHDPAQAARLASEVLTIDRSGTARLGPVADQLAPARLAALYDMPEEAVRRGLGNLLR
ncbi:MAG: hypothetical protein BGP11_16700 [Rhodobacterales bacterium 65-51]|jgi:iron complex transport system ATP-binding protein|uniref:ABC transporter ATP-binding protein n=1 Tax=Gemmobacter nanjingensis TaxID=488454 RepID=A0ABQ3FI98_9RHOB|nr:ABC transporter ATP-binding protein [Gemmobacter nanjingensis]OJY34914.1 MAG: hypothetical protein BGP11_16700 [Rhodobacterales bacterium 65-51]GHC24608.1 putative ABC transporter ATP-binding protein [Gemmobacter nanjingensis]